MRLPRPYIPWSVREQVIDRQMIAAKFEPTQAAKEGFWRGRRTGGGAERRVRWKLEEFFAGKPVELHHDPALVNRRRFTHQWGDGPEIIEYDPPANDPAHLVYLVAGAGEEHDVRTRVRGEHGQHSDLALARKRKRKERKMLAMRGRLSTGKRTWPRRRLPSRPFRRRKR